MLVVEIDETKEREKWEVKKERERERENNKELYLIFYEL